MKNKTINHLLRAFAFAGILLGASTVAQAKETKDYYVLVHNDTNQTISLLSDIEVAPKGKNTIFRFYPLNKEITFTYGDKSIAYPIASELNEKNWDFNIYESQSPAGTKLRICGSYSDTTQSIAGKGRSLADPKDAECVSLTERRYKSIKKYANAPQR